MSTRSDILHWTPADYLSEWKTRRLGLREHGAYRLLLDHMWEATDEQCVFPLDYKALGGIWGVCPEEAVEILDIIQAPGMALLKIVKRKRVDHLFSKRLHEQADKARAFRSAQSEKGKRSGAVRRAKTVNPGSTGVKPGSNPDEPSYLVTRSPVSPEDLDQTPCSSSPEGLQPLERRGYPQADAEPILAYFAGKVDGRDLTRDEDKTIRRWVETYDEGPVREEIGACFEARNTGAIDVKKPIAYIESALKKRATGGAS